MIDKNKVKKLIEEKKYEEVLNIFSKEYLDTLKTMLKKKDIEFKEDLTLIEAIMMIDANFGDAEIITHIITETIFMESREIESRANYALNWYERWIENVNNFTNI